MGYKDDVTIDRFNLDTEWETHASKFLTWVENSAEAQFERDKAEEQLGLLKAQIDNEIRVRYADKKITEAAIFALIVQDVRYQEANNKHLLSIKNAKIIDGAQKAFEHRKKALEKISDLWIAGYWSSPKINREAKQEHESSRTKEQKDMLSQNDRLKRRRPAA